MGYLICNKCRGYYKLQPGDNPDDFTDKCACGGDLRYAIDIEVVGDSQQAHQSINDEDQHKAESTISEYESSKSNEDKAESTIIKDKGEKSDENSNELIETPFNRRWVLIFGVLICISSLMYPIALGFGILALILGLFLYFTDSWILYLIIFSLWTFNGILILLTDSLLSTFFGVLLIFIGGSNLYRLYKKRKSKVSGHIN